jgi:disulfide bond formation protein DsbB
MRSEKKTTLHSSAYRTGGFALFGAVAVIIVALGFEYIGGYSPCPLCSLQRFAYYAAIPALFAALVLVAAEREKAAALLFLAVGCAFLVNAGLGIYHAGVEWQWWHGPATCATPSAGPTTTAADLIKNLEHAHVTRCDEAPWRLAGLSFAGWNVGASVVLCLGALQAADAARHA